MTYVYKVVKVKFKEHNIFTKDFVNSFSKDFKKKNKFDGLSAVIKLGIPSKAKTITPACQMSKRYIKSRCNKAKFIGVEKFYLATILKNNSKKSDDLCHMNYYDITNFMKKHYNIDLLCYTSYADRFFTYKIGEYAVPHNFFDENPIRSCSSGIHYVDTIKEAIIYFTECILHDYYNKVQEVETDGIFSEDRN